MKNGSMITMLFIIAAAIGFSRPALAHMDAKARAQFVLDLRQASAELKGSNAGLSGKLDDYADEKEKWSKKYESERPKKAENVASIRQASNELKGSNKPLADKLDDIADECQDELNKTK